MENFKIESKYLKLCNEFRAVIRCMKTAFYRPDYQKLLMCPSIKRFGRAIVTKHAVEPLKGSAELLKHLTEFLRALEKTKSSDESCKNSAKCLKSSAGCLCYNTAHATPISHSRWSSL